MFIRKYLSTKMIMQNMRHTESWCKQTVQKHIRCIHLPYLQQYVDSHGTTAMLSHSSDTCVHYYIRIIYLYMVKCGAGNAFENSSIFPLT